MSTEQIEAIMRIVQAQRICARQTFCDYDPAGSSCEYEPVKQRLEDLSLLAGREITESDLFFSVDGQYCADYSIRPEVAEFIRVHLGRQVEKGAA